MDSVHNALTALLPTKPSGALATKAYDTAIKQHIAALNSSVDAIGDAALSNPELLLDTLNPSTSSIGYLYVLNILLNATDPAPPIAKSVLLDKILDFLTQFDPVQVRYFGQPMLDLLERVASGRLFSPPVAVELLATAILRIDPSGSLFTSTHLLLAKLAYDSNCIQPALKVMDRDIIFYPNMANSKDSKVLCDPALSPIRYISSQTGLTAGLKPSAVLEYNHVRGLMYMSLREWSKAQEAFEQVISHPSRDRSVSKIMVESYKRWILVGLLGSGDAPKYPKHISGSASSTYAAAAKPYSNVADVFSTTNAQKLKSEVEENVQIWQEDGTDSILAEVLSSYQKWQILNLRRIYQRVGITYIQETTVNAETGKPLESNETTLLLVREMIGSGMLDGEIEQDGNEIYLSFRDDGDMMDEAKFAKRLEMTRQRITSLGTQYAEMDSRLCGNKDYVKHLVREQKRADKDVADAGIGFDSQIEDEDLMSGILTHS